MRKVSLFIHSSPLLIVLVLMISGCVSFPNNAQLKAVGQADAYSFNNIQKQAGGMGDNLMILTFSGGGARAGALAYGVMKQLEEVQLPDGKSLLDEAKIISSVSGGSFVAAYYGLHGKEKFFTNFKKDVLYSKLNSHLIRNVLRFVNWIPIALSGDLGRSDLSQKLYDKFFFHHKTFKDMPRKWPFIIINASDMTRGNSFSFIQENFDLLCSDLNSVKISRAVVSSSAFPGPFTPLTFRNYPKSSCGYKLPEWVELALAKLSEEDPEQFLWAQNLKAYADVEARPYIHVFDGGIADNLGLRPVLDPFRMGTWDVFDKDRRFKAKRIILIIVNAKPADNLGFDQKSKIPGLMAVMRHAASKPLANYTVKTAQEFAMRMAENKTAARNYEIIRRLCDQVNISELERQACYDQFQAPFGGLLKPPFPELYMVHVQFDSVRDESLRDKLGRIETSLQLPKEDINLLEKTGGELLFQSILFQKLMKDLDAIVINKKLE